LVGQKKETTKSLLYCHFSQTKGSMGRPFCYSFGCGLLRERRTGDIVMSQQSQHREEGIQGLKKATFRDKAMVSVGSIEEVFETLTGNIKQRIQVYFL
jgi:hypothetical protein